MVMCLQATLNNIFYYCFTLEKLAVAVYQDSRPAEEDERVVLLRDTLKKPLFIFFFVF